MLSDFFANPSNFGPATPLVRRANFFFYFRFIIICASKFVRNFPVGVSEFSAIFFSFPNPPLCKSDGDVALERYR